MFCAAEAGVVEVVLVVRNGREGQPGGVILASGQSLASSGHGGHVVENDFRDNPAE